MGIRSSDQQVSSILPSWVVVDQGIDRKALASFRHDDDPSTAEARASNGEIVRVSFTVRPLPGASRLWVHWPEGRKPSGWNRVVAAHGNAVLFRLEVDFEDSLIVLRDRPLHLLGQPFRSLDLTSPTLVLDRGGDRGSSGRRGTGLLLDCDTGDFVVAELHLDLDRLEDVDAPLEAQLLRLCSDRGKIAAGAAGEWEWEVKHAGARGGKAKFSDLLCWWEASMVVPYRSYLCWVDYSRGVIFCNVGHSSPDLQYLSLPVDQLAVGCASASTPAEHALFPVGYPDHFSRGWPQASRAVCVTKNGAMMKFINIARSDGMLSGESEHGCRFTITVSTLMHHGQDDMGWVTDTTIQAAQLWDMEGYDDQLPCVVPQFPLVSMDDPNTIYFVLKERHTVSAWVVALDVDSSKVLWYKDIQATPSDEDAETAPSNIFCSLAFFPTEFTKHLQKAAPVPPGFFLVHKCD
ncbi:unnamed protein product [Miscanthus lutarioriparius]|uniref:DUF1618 domain-containing protein n=1 Tax=Miscanthus lutarioriparius TaxID=422564 RepID=A0A811RYD0_9POAL|nr:unnamed protein product [Miscanthus lutarioriparius]